MRSPGVILYVDDDPALQRLVERTLKRRGHTVVLASDAEQGLAALKAGGIDVVALDHNLPTGTGIDLMAELPRLNLTPTVVYVTASAEMATAVAALKGGASDFVLKTVGEDFLLLLTSAIEGALEKTRLRAARDAAEREMRVARERAELLLGEVNHRVANSLAMVSSLVGLQANAVSDQVAKDALAETKARIFAIASVHQRLYSSGEVGVVELREYLEALLNQLDTTMRGEGAVASIVKAMDPVNVATEQAISLGIIVTELVTNAFKYAYPDGHKGEIRVRMEVDGNDDRSVRLSVADDGPGWDGEGPARGTGLGSKIIAAMAQQLGGTVSYFADGGTTVVVAFSPRLAHT
ncbi:sensor histidine kinase [Devosia sp.]|uniref:sensor histidine kinase n=1 Tax=Devosia sp. TaxID=1871048 RepID=UPI003A95650C